MSSSKKLIVLRAIIIIAVIWFYALLTGFSPSVCRSALMLSFVVLGKAMNKNQNTYNLIAISAFFLLLYDPYYLFDVGFQLSYLAVIGLVYFHPIIFDVFYIKNKLLEPIWSYCALSIAAQLATFPLSIYYFHQFRNFFFNHPIPLNYTASW
jgi:competence protein ComEC